MSSIFNVAMLLRKSILKSKKWEFEGAFDDVFSDNIPEEWKRLFRLILVGPKQFDIQNKKDDAERRVMNIFRKSGGVRNEQNPSLRTNHC